MKNILLLIFFTGLALNTRAQENLAKAAQPIIEEGKKLYRSEKASWNGTDLFTAKYKENDKIGGYFSYPIEMQTTCVFYSKDDAPTVIGTIVFDSTLVVENAKMDFKKRAFTPIEKDYYELRIKTFEAMQYDTLFKYYSNTKFNVVPLINGIEKKVYILTGTNEKGHVLFGNDYLLTFDEDNEILEKKSLHENLMAIEYGGEVDENEEMVGAVHSHSEETGDFITATDICTLMLYSEHVGWKTHTVVSRKYFNFWNCETNTLAVIPRDNFSKPEKEEGKDKKDGDH